MGDLGRLSGFRGNGFFFFFFFFFSERCDAQSVRAFHPSNLFVVLVHQAEALLPVVRHPSLLVWGSY